MTPAPRRRYGTFAGRPGGSIQPKIRFVLSWKGCAARPGSPSSAAKKVLRRACITAGRRSSWKRASGVSPATRPVSHLRRGENFAGRGAPAQGGAGTRAALMTSEPIPIPLLSRSRCPMRHPCAPAPRFFCKPDITHRDPTAWLGRQDSNLRMSRFRLFPIGLTYRKDFAETRPNRIT
jgi:hypothetical protein